jgi:hypothetical protein
LDRASRRKRDQDRRSVSSAHLSAVPDIGQPGDLRAEAEAALERLVRMNEPGKVSLAGAYALGYCDLAVAQHDGDGPGWFGELDPLETLILGTVWPQRYRDSFEFANSCAAWLRLMRGTEFWPGIERFVGAALGLSEEQDLPVDDGELMLLLAGRLETAGLNHRSLPRELLPDKALDGARFIGGPAGDLALPDAPPDAAEQVARFRAACQLMARRSVRWGKGCGGSRAPAWTFTAMRVSCLRPCIWRWSRQRMRSSPRLVSGVLPGLSGWKKILRWCRLPMCCWWQRSASLTRMWPSAICSAWALSRSRSARKIASGIAHPAVL